MSFSFLKISEIFFCHDIFKCEFLFFLFMHSFTLWYLFYRDWQFSCLLLSHCPCQAPLLLFHHTKSFGYILMVFSFHTYQISATCENGYCHLLRNPLLSVKSNPRLSGWFEITSDLIWWTTDQFLLQHGCHKATLAVCSLICAIEVILGS